MIVAFLFVYYWTQQAHRAQNYFRENSCRRITAYKCKSEFSKQIARGKVEGCPVQQVCKGTSGLQEGEQKQSGGGQEENMKSKMQ